MSAEYEAAKKLWAQENSTPEEFNRKWKDYLEDRHYGLDISNPDVVKYLDEKFEELTKLPGFKYSQIKMKFGTSRFYFFAKISKQEWLKITRDVETAIDNIVQGVEP